MAKLFLRQIKLSDKGCFAKWWRDRELIKLTSGILKPISGGEVEKYFLVILRTKKDRHFMINLGRKTIGHISLSKRKNDWYETQIVIGEKNYWNKGYGTEAIKLLIDKARRFGIRKIYLEVRPNNKRAIRAYQKAGFIKAGLKRYPKNKYLPVVLRMTPRGLLTGGGMAPV